LFQWPDQEIEPTEFLRQLLERTDALLLLDLENVYANCRNHGGDHLALLDRLPLERIAYVHVAGGCERDGVFHDTHTCPVLPPVLDLVAELHARTDVPGVMLERDGRFPPAAELLAELSSIEAAALRGRVRREVCDAL
jgi:uncharacterized protein (UPF0276 family)